MNFNSADPNQVRRVGPSASTRPTEYSSDDAGAKLYSQPIKTVEREKPDIKILKGRLPSATRSFDEDELSSFLNVMRCWGVPVHRPHMRICRFLDDGNQNFSQEGTAAPEIAPSTSLD
jgi:hypothetical protein